MKITITQTDERSESPFAAAVQFDDGPGHKVTITDPFTPEEEERLEWYYEKWLTFPFTGEVKAGHAAASTQSYGEALFQQLFTDDALAEYKMALRYEGGFGQMAFEIRGTPAFHALHWESLKDPQQARPFAVECPFLRQNDNPPNIHIRPQPSPTLNILLVTARPGGRRDVGYRTISRPLIEALQNSRLRTRIDLVRPGTYEALVKHLEASRDRHGDGFYHIAHFDLHGALLTYEQYQQLEPDAPNPHFYKGYGQAKIEKYDGEKAFLSFNGAKEGEHDLVSDDTVAGLLASHQIPIAILNACQSGKQVGASETSLGSRLMAAGVQNALAMGYSVSVSAAELLMKTLYAQLLDGRPLAQAVRRGRLELRNEKARRAAYNQTIELEDWLLPVMYQNREISLPITDFATPEAEAAYFERQSRRYRAPALAYGFFGRDVDILEIETRLLTQSNVLLIQGMGGAGKTTLLRHLMEWEQTTQLVEKVFYFGYDQKAYTAAQIIDALARDLYGAAYTHAFAPLPDGAKLEKLAQTLRSERHLLVLDNLESITGAALSIQHTLDAAEQAKLRQLLGRLAGGQTLVLLGSRGREAWLWGGQPHGLPLQEQVYELPGLDGEAASDLAKEILQRHQADHYLEDAAERPALTQLLKLLDGHPLALEIVLPNLSRQTPTHLLAAFTQGDDTIDASTGSAGGEVWQDKTASILRCVEYSHSNLSPGAQALLACLTPFTGVVNADWLRQYTQQLQQQPVLANLPFDEWPTVLQEGLNWGLLTPHEVGGGYVRLQPILPYFLRQRLHHLDEAVAGVPPSHFREAVEAAFCAHYDGIGRILAQWSTAKEPQERQTGLALTNLEYENLMTALKWALASGQPFFGLFDPIEEYLDRTQLHQERATLGVLVLQSKNYYSEHDLKGHVGANFVIVADRLGHTYLQLNKYQLSYETYQSAIGILESLEGVSNEWIGQEKAVIYHQLGMVAQEQRQWATAVAHYEKALALQIEFNDRYSQARTYHQLGSVAQAQRQWETAVAHYEKALALKIEFNDRYSQASTYGQLGLLAEAQEHWETAADHLFKALEIFAQTNDQHYTAQTIHNLARVWQASQTQSASHLSESIATRLAALLHLSPAEAAALLNQLAGGTSGSS